MNADLYLPQPNYCRRPTCRKSAYPTKKAAVTVANRRLNGRQRIRRHRPTTLYAYPCDRCGKWHLSSADDETI